MKQDKIYEEKHTKDCVNADKPLMNKSYDLLDDAWLSDMPVNNGLT